MFPIFVGGLLVLAVIAVCVAIGLARMAVLTSWDWFNKRKRSHH